VLGVVELLILDILLVLPSLSLRGGVATCNTRFERRKR